MATDNKFKKQTATQWVQAFPGLKALAQNKLYKIVGPFLLGLDIDPQSSGKYRPISSCIRCMKAIWLFP